MKQVNQKDAMHYISTRQPFKASALTGEFKEYTPSTGRLNSEESAKLAQDFAQALDGYVVFSYSTPVAWFTTLGGWYVVSQKFSPTTSKHQNYIRRAVAESLQGAN